ncbi:MAG: putative secreted protein with sorting signal [Pseudomonadota bacterium]|jgi:hypothetical protein|nr:putative secreted protein with sorting signal [Pseudomonadota bacterium]
MKCIRIALLLHAALLANPAAAAVISWNAAGGLLPDQAGPWALSDGSTVHDPVLSAGVLTLTTEADYSRQMYYGISDAGVAFPASGSYWIEATLKLGYGASAAGWWRAPVVVGIGFDNGNFATLEIASDSIWIRNGNNSISASATVDTDDMFHTYRLEVDGQADGDQVRAYQDGVELLAASSVFYNGGTRSAFWGDATILSYGSSEWLAVSTNVAVVPVPAAAWLMGSAVVALMGARRRGTGACSAGGI